MRKRGYCCRHVAVCLSHVSIVSKRIKISSNFFLGLVAPPLWFSNVTYGCEILTGRGACHSHGLQKFLIGKRLTMAVLESKRPLIVVAR